MREIKFRVFDTKEKTMIAHFKGARIDYALHYWETHKHVSEPMQFTGLLDKNGVEIYEGDIVKLIHKEGQKPFDALYVSEFRDGYFMFREHYKGGANQWIGTITEIPKEVIGNIYENPGLLQPKHKGE